MNNHFKGVGLAVLGVLILSPDSLLIRIARCDLFSTVAIRSFFMALTVLACLLALPRLRKNVSWRPVLLHGIVFAIGSASFTLAVETTLVTNVLVIIAAAPLFAAIFSLLLLGKKTAPSTGYAALTVAIGIGIIFSGDLGGGKWLGNSLALCTALSLAMTTVIIHKNPALSLYPGLLLGSSLLAILFSFFADWQSVDRQSLIVLAIDGGVVAGLSFLLLMSAAYRLQPAEFNLFFLLETVFGSIWVWWLIGEKPSNETLLAGVLILGVLTFHNLWTLLRTKQ